MSSSSPPPSIAACSTQSQTTSSTSNAIETERAKAGFIFIEAVRPGVTVNAELKKIMISTHSKFQKVEVIENSFGRVLVTDGKTQSAEEDEFVYHESLVHPSLIQSGLLSQEEETKPKSIFIGGGGELATAREALRHKSVERVVMVDLDEKVIEACKEFLPEWGGETVTSDPRFTLIIGDAYEYLNNCTEKFDVIIMDISDPIEAGPGIMLYTKEFYDHAKTLLTPNGVFVTQAGTADAVPQHYIEPGSDEDETCFAPIKNTLQLSFDCVIPYSTNIPSFGSDWGFVMAFNIENPTPSSKENAILNFTRFDEHELDKIVSEKITDINDVTKNGHAKNGLDVLRFYDGESHRRTFALPKPLRKKIEKDTRVMTKDNPVFMF